MPVRGRRRPTPRGMARFDGGGRAMRERQMMAAREREHETRMEQLRLENERSERIAGVTKLGKMPLLTTIKQLTEATQTERPEFSAYQVGPRVNLDKLKMAVFGGAQPNRVAQRTTDYNVPPHFDHYFEDFAPWMIHVNRVGKGIVRSAFLSDANFNAYRQVAKGKDMTDPIVNDLLVEQRELSTRLQLASSDTTLLEGSLKDGTVTLLWNGLVTQEIFARSEKVVPPSIHEFRRNDAAGAYDLYARQLKGDNFPEGFVAVE
jgi:hypothetical protein